MNAPLAVADFTPPPPMSAERRAHLYLVEARTELLKVLRLPAFAIPTIAFPPLFYILFALSFGGRDAAPGTSMATYMIATYGAFGVMGAALFSFGIGVAMERGQGWMLAKRATPMPVSAYFAAKMAVSVVFGALIVAILFALGAGFGGVRLSAASWLGLAATLVVGALPFCAFGLFLGYLAGPNSAVPIVNLIYLPVSFASGLWIPVQFLPRFFRELAPWLPPYHYAQLVLKAIGADAGRPAAVHVGALVLFAAICLAGAALLYRRDEGRTWG
jgi:ABC-2 type transport system permease protein